MLPIGGCVGPTRGVAAIASFDQAAFFSSFGRRTRLKAAAAKVKAHPTRSVPRNIGRRIPPTVFIQPNASSIRLRIRWLAAYPIGAVDPVAPQRPHRRSLQSPELHRRPEPEYH